MLLLAMAERMEKEIIYDVSSRVSSSRAYRKNIQLEVDFTRSTKNLLEKEKGRNRSDFRGCNYFVPSYNNGILYTTNRILINKNYYWTKKREWKEKEIKEKEGTLNSGNVNLNVGYKGIREFANRSDFVVRVRRALCRLAGVKHLIRPPSCFTRPFPSEAITSNVIDQRSDRLLFLEENTKKKTKLNELYSIR
ncbi:hypothetical protein V1478_013824 [Vespula squamosa]|uniref:Uncharacterized protein n=1 Tax=Vespula squamosa TaxID=30214 RepID=A0ABD2A690_VESSQ